MANREAPAPSAPVAVRLGSAWRGRDGNAGDFIFRLVTATIAAAVIVTLAALALVTMRAAAMSVAKFGVGFLTSSDWDPVRDAFGALPFIYGTLVSSALALLLAVPVALGVAIYLAELAPDWVRQPLGVMVELLAAIPSVVYGLWGIFVLAPILRRVVEPALGATLGFLPLFRGTPRGIDMLAGGVILAIMILPTIAAVSRDVMQTVPKVQREGALALGATRWETVRMAVLPHARSGIVAAVLLGLGRALGETMAVTMVIGNRAEIAASLFAPAHTMASVIANEYAEAADNLHLAALSELGLILFAVTLLLNVGARFLVRETRRRAAGRA